jgi:hypothetical protein
MTGNPLRDTVYVPVVDTSGNPDNGLAFDQLHDVRSGHVVIQFNFHSKLPVGADDIPSAVAGIWNSWNWLFNRMYVPLNGEYCGYPVRWGFSSIFNDYVGEPLKAVPRISNNGLFDKEVGSQFSLRRLFGVPQDFITFLDSFFSRPGASLGSPCSNAGNKCGQDDGERPPKPDPESAFCPTGGFDGRVCRAPFGAKAILFSALGAITAVGINVGLWRWTRGQRYVKWVLLAIAGGVLAVLFALNA